MNLKYDNFCEFVAQLNETSVSELSGPLKEI